MQTICIQNYHWRQSWRLWKHSIKCLFSLKL